MPAERSETPSHAGGVDNENQKAPWNVSKLFMTGAVQGAGGGRSFLQDIEDE
jgi:hypothetical protein